MDFGDFVPVTRTRTTRASFPRAVLFDLDGTLVDSLPDISAAVAELMATGGYAPYGDDEVRQMVGHGLRSLVTRALTGRIGTPDADELERYVARMREIYPRHLTTRTRLMPHALETLDMLAAAGSQVALVTNKVQAAANTLLDHFGISPRFAVILGDQGRPNGLLPKPQPDMLQFTLSRLATQPGDAIMVGDSEADIGAARAAGVFSVALRNGYSNVPADELGADAVIDHLGHMQQALELWRRG